MLSSTRSSSLLLKESDVIRDGSAKSSLFSLILPRSVNAAE